MVTLHDKLKQLAKLKIILLDHHVLPEEPRRERRQQQQQRRQLVLLSFGARGPPRPVEAPPAGEALRQPREVAA